MLLQWRIVPREACFVNLCKVSVIIVVKNLKNHARLSIINTLVQNTFIKFMLIFLKTGL